MLSAHGYDMIVDPADLEETDDAVHGPEGLVLLNARWKAQHVAARHSDAVVLGVDTLVFLSGVVYGKPKDMPDALRMLRELSGREHFVVSGVCIVHGDGIKEFTEKTAVRFHPRDDEALRVYAERIGPLDKAGAYAAQADDGELIAGFEGSFSNVIGLPMERLIPELAALGVHPSKRR